MAYTVKILSHDKKTSSAKGDLLADKIIKAGINLSLYCNKKRTCGKCFVEIVAVESGDTTGKNYGLAVDIGTSILVMELIDLNQGTNLD
jgi:uncharacterized 2Fe-2S/4Fe-4S cluster protein (DUF4445 family)